MYPEDEDEEEISVIVDDDIEEPLPLPRSTPIMQITLQPTDPAQRLNVSKVWLQRILSHPTLSGYELPREVKGYIYINNSPRILQRGAWAISDDSVYIASHGGIVEPLTKLAILGCVANLTGAINDPAITELFTTRLSRAIAESVSTVYHGLISTTQAPSQLAVDITGSRVAAKINDRWLLTSGAPVEVDASWIVMDF